MCPFVCYNTVYSDTAKQHTSLGLLLHYHNMNSQVILAMTLSEVTMATLNSDPKP